MSLKSHETAIIDHLKTEVAGAQIEAFPDNPKKYMMNLPDSVVLVVYRGSSYSDNKGGNVVVQDRRHEWECVIVNRNLGRKADKAHANAYDLLDAVRSALTGFQIAGFTKTYPIREGFQSETGGIWQYGITFAYNGTHKEI